MMSAKDSKVRGALFAGTFRHGTQPGGLILLSDALWHRSQVFRIDPATVIVLGGQGTATPIRINGGGMEHFCRTHVGVKDNKVIGKEIPLAATPQTPAVNSTRHVLDIFILLTVPRCLALQSRVKG
jgi:hypothetical protein